MDKLLTNLNFIKQSPDMLLILLGAAGIKPQGVPDWSFVATSDGVTTVSGPGGASWIRNNALLDSERQQLIDAGIQDVTRESTSKNRFWLLATELPPTNTKH